MTEMMSEERINNLTNLSMIAEGKNPRQQQMLNDFMDLKNPIERTNLRTSKDVHFITWLEYVSSSYFPNREHDPFGDLSKHNATANMARDAMKSNQVVDLLRNQPDLSGFVQSPMQGGEKQSFVNRLLGRGGKE